MPLSRALAPDDVTPYVARPALERTLEEALRGRGACVVGPAGTGKSRLVTALSAEHRSLVASAATVRHPSARAVLLRLLAPLVEAPRNLVRLLEGRGAEATRGEEELAVLSAAAAFLARTVDLVVVEDAEVLPDEESALLAQAARGQGTWVVVSRATVVGWDLPVVEVGPLEAAEAQALVRSLLPGAHEAVLAAVVERAAGEPLALEQCALSLSDAALHADPEAAAARLHEAPSSLRGFIDMRLDGLPLAQHDVITTASVIGDLAEVDLLRHLVTRPPEEVEALLMSLVGRNLLRLVGGDRDVVRVAFQHGLVREVAYERLTPARRVEIHRAAAEWYAVLPVSQVLESQAHHLEQAVRLGTADCDLVRRTVEAMVLFARSVEEERTSLAAQVLSRAREIADAHPQCAVELLHLELARATVAFLLGESSEEVTRAAERALELSRGDLRAVAEANLHLARGVRYRDEERATTYLDRAQAAFRELEDLAGEARVELERSWDIQLDRGIAQQLVVMGRAYQLAMRSADTRLQAGMAQDLAMHHAFASGRPAFLEWAQRARENTRADDVSLEPKLALAAGTLAMFDCDPQAGLPHTTQACEQGRVLGLAFVLRNGLVVHLDHLVRSGRLAEAREVLAEGRETAERAERVWGSLQLDLLEAQLAQREGRTADAVRLLEGVSRHELAAKAVLQRDLAEARGWVALDRGHFAEARAHATQALVVDQETGERCAPMRPRLIDVVGAVAAGRSVPLGDIAALRKEGRETGLMTVVGLASRWMYVEELSRGWTVDLYGLDELDVIEARALDLEIQALQQREYDLLAEAAAVWAELGTTVWQARALLWHGELTGTPHPDAADLLDVLQAPAGLEQELRAQVRGLPR